MSQNSRQVRFAVVGCGRISPKHFEAISALPDARLVAVADVIPERAQVVASKYDCEWTDDYHSLLDRPDVDVVNICTPSGLHPQIGVEAAAAGKHVVTEKPMALSLCDADRLIEACRTAGVKLFVVHQNRYNQAIKRLHDALASGHFGALTHGSAVIRWCRDQAYYDSADWRGKWASDGGVLMNQSIHNIDLLQWMMGPVESLFAYTTTRLRSIEAEDNAVAVIRFRNGALGIIEGTSTVYPRNLEETLSIFGETGTAVVGGLACNRIQTWRFAAGEPDEVEVLAEQEGDPPSVYGFGHQQYMRDVVKSILEDRPPVIDGHEGRKAVEIVLATYIARKTGLPVQFPVQAGWTSLDRYMKGDVAHD